MKIIVAENFEAMSDYAAQLIEQQVEENKHSVLGLATGSTPLGLYEKLIKGYKMRGISYADVRTINLDEYRGLDKNHPNSYHTFMCEKLFKHIDIPLHHTFIPDGKALSVEKECLRYEALIDEIGPINVQVLGMGTNGHIGFNEPGTPESSLTHCVRLTESTRKNNARFFSSLDEVPTHAITMGIASIMKSEKIILMASGRKKAEAVKTLLTEKVTEDFPASFLWKHHDVTLIVDQDAYQASGKEKEVIVPDADNHKK